MSATAIRCEGVSKRYRIGERERYQTLRDTIARGAARLLRRDRQAEERATIWALDDISFELAQGEVMGIIGRNGAGKSTLLKILSRITKPTRGRAEIRGRVGSLLEVGTGFHPELTGRENIYLNGAILGIKRREIGRRFDEIVAFAEIDRFLDTPVKHYSSGMYMRLAFAVAAHLETEVLFVDEVLAVGDAAFQKKCLGTMGNLAQQGRTVLFVSHNLLAVNGLCTRAICLHEGRVVADGPPTTITSQYLREWVTASSEVVYDDLDSAPGSGVFRLRRASVQPLGGSPSDSITVRTAFVVEFEYWKLADRGMDLAADLFNELGIHLFTTVSRDGPPQKRGLLRSSFVVPGDLLNNGSHHVDLTAYTSAGEVIVHLYDVLSFDVHDAVSELRGFYHGAWPGALRPHLTWTTERLGDSFAAR